MEIPAIDREIKMMLETPTGRSFLMRMLYELFHIYDIGFPHMDLRDAGLKLRNLIASIDMDKLQLAEREYREALKKEEKVEVKNEY